jgi:hypothetical protein
VENDIPTTARLVAQDRIGKKKETVECRPFIEVSLPAQFEAVENNPTPDEAAHYRKTARRNESGRSKKRESRKDTIESSRFAGQVSR